MAPCQLKVVLLCSGNGADVSSYRPRRDESQWWNRRDALVRCVASFLFGPPCASDDSRELILLYDGDHCRVHMKMEDHATHGDVIPSEFTVIALWKEAITKALNANTSTRPSFPAVVRRGPLCCWAELSSSPMPQSSQSEKARIQDWNKRQLLEYLQKECSMEFLREHKLNSAPNVILRKANRNALAKVCQEWQKSNKKSTDGSDHNNTDKTQRQLKELDTIFREILATENQQYHNKDHQVIAATLHESSECELPCFGELHDKYSSNNNPLHLCLFLGAVRDMIPVEYQALERVCSNTSYQKSQPIPLVKVRLGSVPEFTSKILSVVAFHHCHKRLGPAMQKLAQDSAPPGSKRKLQVQDDDTKSDLRLSTLSEPRPPHLHILCFVPLHADQIVTDLEQRERTLWCIVRVLVCSLWRSRLAGISGRSSLLENTVTLILLDGNVVTLHQKEWVSAMAEQHQAAPSEYQVLKALIDQLQTQQKSRIEPSTTRSWNEQRATKLLIDLLPYPDESSPRNVISFEANGATDLTRRFYTEGESSCDGTIVPGSRDLLALLPIDTRSMAMAENSRQAHGVFLQALHNNPSFRVLRQSILAPWAVSAIESVHPDTCGDCEASYVTVLQHFLYQNRLFVGDHVAMKAKVDAEDAMQQHAKKKRKNAKKKRKDPDG
jgi:Basic tilted helix bundle domain